jgi:hypothetical protein
MFFQGHNPLEKHDKLKALANSQLCLTLEWKKMCYIEEDIICFFAKSQEPV